MKKTRLCAALFLAICLAAGAQQTGGGKDTKNGTCGLLYGKDHALTFCAPDGWVLDNGILNDQGIYAVFYPEGSNWKDAKDSGTFMYINVIGKQAGATVKTLMDDDTAQAKRAAPGAVVQPGEPVKIGDLRASVLQFAPGAFERYEAVAYIGEEKVLVMIVVSSKNQSLFAKDYPAFVKLVQSYKYLSSEVTFEHQ